MGHEAVASMCVAIEGWAVQLGKPKRNSELLLPPQGLDDAIRALIGKQVRMELSGCGRVHWKSQSAEWWRRDPGCAPPPGLPPTHTLHLTCHPPPLVPCS